MLSNLFMVYCFTLRSLVQYFNSFNFFIFLSVGQLKIWCYSISLERADYYRSESNTKTSRSLKSHVRFSIIFFEFNGRKIKPLREVILLAPSPSTGLGSEFFYQMCQLNYTEFRIIHLIRFSMLLSSLRLYPLVRVLRANAMTGGVLTTNPCIAQNCTCKIVR